MQKEAIKCPRNKIKITRHPFNWKCHAENTRKYISNLQFVTGALTMLVLGLVFDYLIVHGKEKARTD